MRIILFFLLLSITTSTIGQNFLTSYKQYKLSKFRSMVDSSHTKPGMKRKFIKLFDGTISNQILQLDTLFSKYNKNNSFNFNTADSLTIIYQTDITTGLSDYIVISGVDTLSYSEDFLIMIDNSRKKIVYNSFLDTSTTPGFVVTTSRDSLLTLVNKGRFDVANKLAQDHPVLDGQTTTIVVAKKINNRYRIDEYHLRPFDFIPIWRKE